MAYDVDVVSAQSALLVFIGGVESALGLALARLYHGSPRFVVACLILIVQVMREQAILLLHPWSRSHVSRCLGGGLLLLAVLLLEEVSFIPL